MKNIVVTFSIPKSIYELPLKVLENMWIYVRLQVFPILIG